MIAKITFYSINKLRSLIKVQKDPLATSSRRNVVYKIVQRLRDFLCRTNWSTITYTHF